jgi:hypothetical protein
MYRIKCYECELWTEACTDSDEGFCAEYPVGDTRHNQRADATACNKFADKDAN